MFPSDVTAMNSSADASDASIDEVAAQGSSRGGWQTAIVRRLRSLISAALIVLAGTTLLGFAARYHWVADLMANLRIQQCLALMGCIVLTLLVGRRVQTMFAGALLVIHGVFLIPAWQTEPSPTITTAKMRVMALNVRGSNQAYSSIVDQIRTTDPDLLAIIELRPTLMRHLDAELAEHYPHCLSHPREGNFGLAIFSKRPLIQPRLIEDAGQTPSLAATVEEGERKLRFVATHPVPPLGRANYRRRNQQLQAISKQVADQLRNDPRTAIVLAGDFNLTPWSPLYRDVESASRLRWAGRGHGWTPTWYASPASWWDFPFGLVLDHVMISEQLACEDYDVGGPVGSDHRAVIATLTWRREESTFDE